MRSLKRYRPALYGFTISLAVHVAVILLVYCLLPRPPRGRPGEKEPVYLTIRLVAPGPEPEKPAEEESRPRLAPQDFRPRIEKPVPIEAPRPTLPPAREETPEVVDSTAARLDIADLKAPPLPGLTREQPSTIGHGSAAAARVSLPSRGTRALASRDFRGRAERLRRYGGSEGTENAVTRGLAWLAAHQDTDGKWDAEGFNRHCPGMRDCLGSGRKKFNVGVTSLCVLAFLGAAHSPSSDTLHRETVTRGLEFLLNSQDEEGCFGRRNDNLFYNHAIATFALAEAYGMTGDGRYKKAAFRALKFSERYQQAGGGWDYETEPSGRDDLSITGWQVMAIRAARQVGIPVSSRLLSRVREYLDRVVERDGSAVYADRGTGAGRKGLNMIAVAMLSRIYLGAPLADARVRSAASWLERNPPDYERTYEWNRYFQSTYYWYTGTLALFHYGGRPWDTWNWVLKKTALPKQSRRPHEEGSWDVDANWIGVSGGRITSTALMVLTFEIYYRYEPLHAYRKPGKER